MMNSSRRRAEGLSSQKKKDIWDTLADLLQDSQTATSGERKRLYRKFQKEFYSQSNPQLVNEHQKYFAQTMWRLSILPFSQANSPTVEKSLKFIHMIYLNAGTDEDKSDAGFLLTTYPMFYYILKLIYQSHMDSRRNVRHRILEVALNILKKHSEHERLQNHPELLKQLIKMFGLRLRDKYHVVRALAANLLKYFTEDKHVGKDLKYFSRFDIHSDVRKAAIFSLQNASTRISFFYEHAFDHDAKVRIESFKGLATKSMINLSFDKREMVLYWGLTQEGKGKKVVTEELLPAWFEQCNNNPIEFLKQLTVSTKTKVAFLILNTLYPNDFTETFESIDRSFLDENNLVPIEKLNIETVMFWIFMIKKFRGTRYNLERLIPKPDMMGPYILSMIDAIHAENKKAQEEDRDEDCNLLICLSFVVSIAISVGLEEGTRRTLEDVIRIILLDPILDEAPLIKCTVDAMKQLIAPHLYSERMTSIFQEVFEPNDRTLHEQTPKRRSRLSLSARPGSRSGSAVCTPRRDQRSERSIEREQSMELDHTLEKKSPGAVNPATPKRPRSAIIITEEELTKMKEKVCSLTLQRLRLGEQKSNAVKESNYLEAHRLQVLIDAIQVEEKDLREKIQTPQSSFASSVTPRRKSMPPSNCAVKSNPSMNESRSRHSLSNTIMDDNNRRSNVVQENEDIMDFIPLSQATNFDAGVGISKENMLKGLIMVTRFLMNHWKMTPFVRQLYENHIKNYLVESDSRIRSQTMNFLCVMAMIDPCEKRKIMGLLLKGLEADESFDVKRSAFKSIVDLLLKYDMNEFRCSGDNILINELPHTYNNTDVTQDEMREMFILMLDKYADGNSGMQTPESISEKVSGMIKLLQLSRVTSEHLISDLLCMWSDRQHVGTAVPFNIGMWLPMYTKHNIQNAKLVSKALLISVKKIIAAPDDKESTVFYADFAKLVDFIVQYISPYHIDMPDSEKVHEGLFLDVLQDILQHPSWTGNASLIKIVGRLHLASEDMARMLAETLALIMLKITSFPSSTVSTIGALKLAIKSLHQKILRQFPGLNDIVLATNQVNIQTDTDDSDVEEQERGPFSDDDDAPSIMTNRSLPRFPASTAPMQSEESDADAVEENVSESDSDD